jgi:hypothetical protein
VGIRSAAVSSYRQKKDLENGLGIDGQGTIMVTSLMATTVRTMARSKRMQRKQLKLKSWMREKRWRWRK